MILPFPIAEPESEAAAELGRKLFSGPVDFLKGVVAMDGLPDADRVEVVRGKMPKRLKKRRPVRDDAGEEVGWEEYYDYTFPEEEKKAPSLKILEMARMWKKQKTEPAADEHKEEVD